jgi:hypothetical protein
LKKILVFPAAVVMAAVMLAACGGGSAPSTQGSALPAASEHATTPPADVSLAACRGQYYRWQVAHDKVASAMLSAAGSDSDNPKATADLLEGFARALAPYSMPSCADPHGYWPKLIREIGGLGPNPPSRDAASIDALVGKLLAEVNHVGCSVLTRLAGCPPPNEVLKQLKESL